MKTGFTRAGGLRICLTGGGQFGLSPWRVVVLLFAMGLMSLASTANATVAVNGLFSDHTVLQRDKPCPVWGTAAANKTIAVVEGLLYNVEGLPANPFYLDDVRAKYTVTASGGAHGSISHVGATTYLKRKTVLYAITPEKTSGMGNGRRRPSSAMTGLW